MASATDIITYIGIPLAVAGTFPLLWNMIKSFYIRHKLWGSIPKRYRPLYSLSADVASGTVTVTAEIPSIAQPTLWRAHPCTCRTLRALAFGLGLLPLRVATILGITSTIISCYDFVGSILRCLSHRQRPVETDEEAMVLYRLQMDRVKEVRRQRLIDRRDAWTPYGCVVDQPRDRQQARLLQQQWMQLTTTGNIGLSQGRRHARKLRFVVNSDLDVRPIPVQMSWAQFVWLALSLHVDIHGTAWQNEQPIFYDDQSQQCMRLTTASSGEWHIALSDVSRRISIPHALAMTGILIVKEPRKVDDNSCSMHEFTCPTYTSPVKRANETLWLKNAGSTQALPLDLVYGTVAGGIQAGTTLNTYNGVGSLLSNITPILTMIGSAAISQSSNLPRVTLPQNPDIVSSAHDFVAAAEWAMYEQAWLSSDVAIQLNIPVYLLEMRQRSLVHLDRLHVQGTLETDLSAIIRPEHVGHITAFIRDACERSDYVRATNSAVRSLRACLEAVDYVERTEDMSTPRISSASQRALQCIAKILRDVREETLLPTQRLRRTQVSPKLGYDSLHADYVARFKPSIKREASRQESSERIRQNLAAHVVLALAGWGPDARFEWKMEERMVQVVSQVDNKIDMLLQFHDIDCDSISHQWLDIKEDLTYLRLELMHGLFQAPRSPLWDILRKPRAETVFLY